MIAPLVDATHGYTCIEEPTSIEVGYHYAKPPRSFTDADFPSRKKRHKRNSPNILKLFFEDIEQQPTIDGREHYLPLTRQVQFKVIWEEVPQNSGKNVVASLANQLQAATSEFNTLCLERGTPKFDLIAVGYQLESFFDDPSMIMPEALSQSLANYRDMTNPDDEVFARAGWRVIYLLSLLPPSMRNYPVPPFDEGILTGYIKTRLQEADEAQKTLVSGTLRYVTNVAATYIGRGVPYLDLISEGYFGLLRATETFREYMGGHFQQHAATWIHQKIGRALNEQVPIIRQPVHLGDKLRTLNAEVERFQDSQGRLPYDDELRAVDFDDEENPDLIDGDEEALAKLQSKRRQLFQYLMQMNGPHAILDKADYSSKRDFLFLFSAESLAESEETYIHDGSWLHTFIEREGKHRLNDRGWQILQLRMGWGGDEPQTLEEIAQQFGLTRERIRQIEFNALRRLESLKTIAQSWFSDVDRHENILQRTYRKLQNSLESAELDLGSLPSQASQEQKAVEDLIAQHVKRARRGNFTRRVSRQSYSSLLIDALRQVERPAHYKQVYTKVLEIAPDNVQFSPQAVYAFLYTNSRVRSLGNGYFDLESAAPNDKYSIGTDEKTLLYCPRPMIADAAHPRAFLESALRLQEHLRSGQVIDIQTLLRAETEWANNPKKTTPQEAIDAWYGTNLIEWIDYRFAPQTVITFTLPRPLKMQDLRMWCLSSICTRIVKTFDVLTILNRVTVLTTQEIQKLLFGVGNGDFDVRNRLEMLAAFDAVREERNTWMITDIGRGVVSARSESDLPDLEALTAVQPDLELVSEANDLDDLDIFDL